jgi:hypothetical protein
VSRNVLLTLALALATLVSSVARAETRVVVRPFYGPHGDSVRQEIESILEHRSGVILVSSKEADSSAKKLGTDANSPEGRKVVARELNVSAWVEGIVQKRGNKLRLTVLVYDGVNHDRVGRTTTMQKTPGGLLSDLKKHFWQKSKVAITRAASPSGETGSSNDGDTAVAEADTEESDESEDTTDESSADEEADAEEEVAEATPAADTKVKSTSTSTVFLPSFMPTVESQSASSAAPRNDAAPTLVDSKDRAEALRIIVGLGTPFRSLSYSDPVSQELGNYQLNGAPMIDMRAAFFPASYVTKGWASYLGLDLRAQFALGIRTVDTEGHDYKSRYGAYHAGLLGRVPVGKHFVRAFAGYAAQSFTVKSQEKDIASPTPNVDYRMMRAGGGGELRITDTIVMTMEAAWLQMLSVGQIGQWFPRATAGGVEVGMDATYAVSPRFFARAFGTYQRVFFDFNSKPEDTQRVGVKVAGGATDTYLTFGLGAGVRL